MDDKDARAEKLARLRELVAEGIASGSEPFAPDEFERVKREGRMILARRKPKE